MTKNILNIEIKHEAESARKYFAYHNGQLIATVQIPLSSRTLSGDVSVLKIEVVEQYRRMGVATQIYDRIEADLKSLGLRLTPSAKMLSPDGQRFWDSRNPQLLREINPYVHNGMGVVPAKEK